MNFFSKKKILFMNDISTSLEFQKNMETGMVANKKM